MSNYNRTNELFCDQELFVALDTKNKKISERIAAIPEQQFINAGDSEIVNHVVSELQVHPIEIYEDKMEMENEEIIIDMSNRRSHPSFLYHNSTKVNGIRITVSIPFTGDSILWTLKPNNYRSVVPHGRVRPKGHEGIGYLEIIIEEPVNTDPESIKQQSDSTLKDIRFYLEAQKVMIERYNRDLNDLVRQAVSARRTRLGKHNKVVEMLGIPLKRKDGVPDISAIPIKRKLVRPLPAAPDKPPEPGISNEDYEHILGVIRHEGCSFETTRKTYSVHDEEELRDMILAHLNGHYQGNATGETFRGKGKTDIRIEDNKRAAFVAECKVWRGQAELTKAIDQLLGYLTWRDCKTSIIIFNKNKAGFTEIQKKIPEVFIDHPNYIKTLSCQKAGEWCFECRSKSDENRMVIIHVFAFDLYVS
jgi:hypothetical protein